MKKMFLFMLMLTASVFMLFSSKVNAAGKQIKPTDLKANHTYKYDLNCDGKAETIYYKSTCKEEGKATLYLYINGKLAFTKRNLFDANSNFYTICDLNKNDKKLDLYLRSITLDDILVYSTFQQYEDSKILNLKVTRGDNTNFKLSNFNRLFGLSLFDLKNIKSDGKFTIATDSLYGEISEIGQYLMKIPFELKGKRIICKDSNDAVLSSDSQKYKYVTAKEVTVYQNADSTSTALFTLSKGETLTIKKIKAIGDYKKKNYNFTGYAYVTTKKGSGWIYFGKRDCKNPMFKEIPQWS